MTRRKSACFLCAFAVHLWYIHDTFTIHINGTEILATIGSDPQHAANDIQGLSVFDLPEDAPVIRGAREALTKLEIL